MNFLDSIKRQEREKHRISAWSRAVAELSRFIRHHLRQAEAQSPLTVRPNLIRLDKVLFNRLTLLLNGRTVTITPLSLADPRTPERGGCVAVRSTNGANCDLLWNGDLPAAPNNWTIAGEGFIVGENPLISETLCEASLDNALNLLFGLSGRAESRGGGLREAMAPVRSAGALPFAANAFYSKPIRTNGMLDAKEANAFAPSYRKS